MRLLRALLLLACLPTAGALAADIDASGTSVARAAAAGPLTITEAGDGTGLRWAAWSERTASSGSVRLALFDARKAPAAIVWSQAWADTYDPQLVLVAPWDHAGHPIYALTLRFGAEAQQVDLVSLDAAGKPAILAEKLGAAVGLVLETEKAAVIVYQTPKAALVPSCFEWRDAAGNLAEVPCLR